MSSENRKKARKRFSLRRSVSNAFWMGKGFCFLVPIFRQAARNVSARVKGTFLDPKKKVREAAVPFHDAMEHEFSGLHVYSRLLDKEIPSKPARKLLSLIRYDKFHKLMMTCADHLTRCSEERPCFFEHGDAVVRVLGQTLPRSTQPEIAEPH